MPTTLAPRKMTFSIDTAVALGASPFSFEQQVHQHSGQRWRVEVEMPAMTRENADDYESFLLQLNGPYGTFLLGDVARQAIRGSATEAQINGASQTGSELLVTGLDVSTANVFRRGDWIQLSNFRIHRILQDVTSDSNGDAILDIWPALRESPGDGEEILLSNTKGRFRLESAQIVVSQNLAPDPEKFLVSFSAVEAV